MKNTFSFVRILYDPTRIERQVKLVNCWVLFPVIRPLRCVIMEVIRGSLCDAGPGMNSLNSSVLPGKKENMKIYLFLKKSQIFNQSLWIFSNRGFYQNIFTMKYNMCNVHIDLFQHLLWRLLAYETFWGWLEFWAGLEYKALK